MKRSLPPRPNLDQLKNQAKDLLKAHKTGDPEAFQRIKESHPRLATATADAIRSARFTLSGAHLVVAREYGFVSWPKLKAHVEACVPEAGDPLAEITRAFHTDDAERVRQLLDQYPDLKAKINEPMGSFDSPAILAVRSPAMLDVLLSAGADLNAKSKWWAGGFGLLHSASPELAAYAMAKGAVVDVHAAVRLGLMDRLRELVAADPALVHARGGDGQTPLHFAKTVEVAAFLLERGADIDARDVDHESTPAQYALDGRQEITRFLISRGCQTDVLMVAALGDLDLVRRHLDADPGCIRMRVSDEYFPMIGGKTGGTIYQWTLGWYVSAHQVARKLGHEHVYRLLMERSDPATRLITACWVGDEAALTALRGTQAQVVTNLSAAERRQAADAARNNDLAALRRMVDAGFPIDARSQHQATPLHWAGFHGNAEMARVLLALNPPLEVKDADFQSTPLGWTIHGSEHGWHRQEGDYAATAALLLEAGAKPPDKIDGSQAVREVLAARGMRRDTSIGEVTRGGGTLLICVSGTSPINSCAMSEVTRILSAIEQGDPSAAEQLLPLVYDELRKLAAQKLAQEKPGQTLQATALVHEAYLRLVESAVETSGGVHPRREPHWNSRGHFFAAAAEAMRRILINRARDRNRLKRGGGRTRIALDQLADPSSMPDEELLLLDDALERLATAYPQCAELVKLRFFAGLTHEQAADALGLARRSADRQWVFARAWLFNALGGE